MVKPVIFILGISALPLAQKLKAELNGEIHTPDCVSGGDVSYAKATAHLAQLFQQGQTIIGLCASGILIRAIAPHLNDKRTEPPVIAVAEDGSSIVPLLGGHHGANALAAQIAKITGGHAAITTASEVRFGFAFDERDRVLRLLTRRMLNLQCALWLALHSPKSVIPAKARIHSVQDSTNL